MKKGMEMSVALLVVANFTTVSVMYELQNLSDKIKELTKNRND